MFFFQSRPPFTGPHPDCPQSWTRFRSRTEPGSWSNGPTERLNPQVPSLVNTRLFPWQKHLVFVCENPFCFMGNRLGHCYWGDSGGTSKGRPGFRPTRRWNMWTTTCTSRCRPIAMLRSRSACRGREGDDEASWRSGIWCLTRWARNGFRDR